MIYRYFNTKHAMIYIMNLLLEGTWSDWNLDLALIYTMAK